MGTYYKQALDKTHVYVNTSTGDTFEYPNSSIGKRVYGVTTTIIDTNTTTTTTTTTTTAAPATEDEDEQSEINDEQKSKAEKSSEVNYPDTSTGESTGSETADI